MCVSPHNMERHLASGSGPQAIAWVGLQLLQQGLAAAG